MSLAAHGSTLDLDEVTQRGIKCTANAPDIYLNQLGCNLPPSAGCVIDGVSWTASQLQLRGRRGEAAARPAAPGATAHDSWPDHQGVDGGSGTLQGLPSRLAHSDVFFLHLLTAVFILSASYPPRGYLCLGREAGCTYHGAQRHTRIYFIHSGQLRGTERKKDLRV